LGKHTIFEALDKTEETVKKGTGREQTQDVKTIE